MPDKLVRYCTVKQEFITELTCSACIMGKEMKDGKCTKIMELPEKAIDEMGGFDVMKESKPKKKTVFETYSNIVKTKGIDYETFDGNVALTVRLRKLEDLMKISKGRTVLFDNDGTHRYMFFDAENKTIYEYIEEENDEEENEDEEDDE